MRKFVKIVAGAAVLVSTAALTIGPAFADPQNSTGKSVTPKETDVVGVGADTDEYLFNQFAFDYNRTHKTGARLYSWDALNPTTNLTDNIKTKSGCPSVVRPNGASAGILTFDVNTKTSDKKDFCIDYARSARSRSTSDPHLGKGGVLFVTLAKDAIGYATNKVTNAPANLTTAQLAAIYSCTDTTWSQVGGSSSATIQPFLPQTGSGLRTSFLKAIGNILPGSCVNSTVQQNEGTDPQFAGNPNSLVPYSVAKYISQVFHSAKCGVKPTASQNKFGCDQHGSFVLNKINGTKPTTGTGANTVINPKYTANFINVIYDVVRWASTKDHIPAYLQPFFSAHKKTGVSGWLCTSSLAKADLVKYGFLPTPFCGTGS